MLTVEEIESGTVIDHIRHGKGLRVLEILEIAAEYHSRVALVMNVPSNKMGRKDIVKVEGKLLNEKLMDKIALIAPDATVNLIQNSKVIEKRHVKLHSKLVGVVKCPNPKCITNTENIESVFIVEADKARCAFCERLFKSEELIE
ncbi:MAG: aspartate carbamoyltransferase regulatory subunit [Candidatus Micrarchaeota archaeon]|nr:aspartate carbamoyltransferase regulatory subunit [Candidatus Micrarchaeota archaeon]